MASVPFVFNCDKSSGFVTDLNQHRRVGYVTSLKGFNMSAALNPDMQVSVPVNPGATPTFTGIRITGARGAVPTAGVIGLIEKFEWNGGVGDPIRITFYVSQWNSVQLKASTQNLLQATSVNALAWWICEYDAVARKWYEQAYPIDGQVTGIVASAQSPDLTVDRSPVLVNNGADVNVYKVTLGVVPAANREYRLQFASSALAKVTRQWGLDVGKLAAAPIP